MATLTPRIHEPVIPSTHEATIAKLASRALATHMDRVEDLRFQILEHKKTPETLSLPASAIHLLFDILKEMAAGNAITIIPVHAELTTQQAADVLNVSRPFLIQLLEQRKIPFHKVGTHRRILYQDLMRYKKHTDAQRRGVLDQLSQEAQELNMGY